MKSTVCFRRLAHTAVLFVIGLFALCGIAEGQASSQLVTSGSVIPLAHSTSYCQVFKILNAPSGDTVMLDVCGNGGYGSLYQLKKGSNTILTIAPSIDSSGTYFNEGMAMDAKGTLYITDRYGSAHVYRIPYNPGDQSWDFNASTDNFYPTINNGFDGGKGTDAVAFFDSPAKDGSGTLFIGEETEYAILAIPVNADGTVSTFKSGPAAGQLMFQYIINGLQSNVMPMETDVNGNVYFIENPGNKPANRANGVFFIPGNTIASCMAKSASGASDPTVPCISGNESALQRIDPGNPEKYNGLTLDAAGNVYVSDQNNGAQSTVNGLFEIPNTSGSPVGVTASSFDFGSIRYIAPVGTNANPTIDKRGFIWLPTGTSSLWSPAGSGAIPGPGNFVLWQPGSTSLGTTPVGTPSATGITFYNFSGTVTPTSIGISQAGGGMDFAPVATNPYPPASGTTPAVPCTAGMQYIANGSCEVWTAATPQGANAVGNISGQLALLDATNKPIAGSVNVLNAVGQGPAASLLIPANQTPLAAQLTAPAQVSGDSLGNAYVADPGQGKVLMFPSTASGAAGTAVGAGLTSPTGVAVDGSGDIFIADSGSIQEIPSINGTLNPGGQTTVQSGLGGNVNLAVDTAGNVYAADPSNARVVKVFNPQVSMLLEGTQTVGSGFTKPTAVATDDAGNVFVADGANLVEVNFFGGQTTITSSLAAPVTGLAVEPSGSVLVAQANGILRIPLEAAGLNANDAAVIDGGGVTAPSGLGTDSLGNVYVTAASYNTSSVAASGPVSTPVTTPNVLLLNGALVNFGLVSQQTSSNPIDVNVYNIGNAPLSLTGAPTFGGANAADYSIQQDGQNPCDTSGATPVPSGTACQLGVTATTLGLANSTATMAVLTNAVNAPTTNAVLLAYSSNNLCRTSTAITLNPASGLVYPGATQVSSTTTAQDPTCSPGNVPQGGNVVLTLVPQAKGASISTQTAVLPASGQYTFNLKGLNGGTYVLYVSYRGDTLFGGSSSTRTFTVTVAQAAPTVKLASPGGVTAIGGIYYVGQGTTATLSASVTSTVGTPTGTVSFDNGTGLADPKQGPVTLDASGTATFSTSNLAQGPNTSNLGQIYKITAVYSGDNNFSTVTSAPVTIEIIPAVALIEATPAAVTTKAGVAVTTPITVQPLNGYQAKLGAEIYCDSTTLPKFTECTFDVPKLDIFDAKGAPVTTNLTITSNLAVSLSEVKTTKGSAIAFAGLFGAGVLGLAFRRRLKLHGLAIALFSVALLGGGLAGLTGCTNSGYTQTPPKPSNTTPPGTYNVSLYTVDLQTNQRSSLPFTISVTIQ